METEKSYIRFQLVFLKRTFINLQRHFKKIIIVIIFQCKKSYFNALKKIDLFHPQPQFIKNDLKRGDLLQLTDLLF